VQVEVHALIVLAAYIEMDSSTTEIAQPVPVTLIATMPQLELNVLIAIIESAVTLLVEQRALGARIQLLWPAVMSVVPASAAG
jgi:hypothetical protein